MTHFNDRSNPDRTQFHELTECLANHKQIFRLIDDILPLELCLHYEILPLQLDGDRLTVGMINLEDENTLNSLLPIVTTFGYTLNPKSIDVRTHQQILASYLKRPNAPQSPSDRRSSDFAQTVIGRSDEAPQSPSGRRSSNFARTVIGRPDEAPQFPSGRRSSDFAQTVIGRPDEAPQPPSDRRSSDFAQTVIGRPDKLPQSPSGRRSSDFARTVIGRPDEAPQPPSDRQPAAFVSQPQDRKEKSSTDRSMTLTEIPTDFELANSTDEITNTSKFLHQSKSSNPTAKPTANSSNSFTDETPHQLWRKFYKRLLDGKSAQFGLKSDHNFCQIAEGHHGESELAWKTIEPSVFTTLANEIKALVKLPPVPLKKPKKVALEKQRDRERVLLRIEFTPTPQGEEIVIAAMRGKTLRSYEQKQKDKMSEQALFLALKLENVVKKMRLSSTGVEPKNLVAIKTALTEINRQLELMKE